MRRFWLYLYSTRNVIASALGLTGLILFFIGLIKSFWLAIVVGLYACGYFLTPRQNEFELQLSQELDLESMHQALDEISRKIESRVMPEILERVESIKIMIIDLLPRLRSLKSCDDQVFIVRQMALHYLPETLENYLNLPPAYARFHPVRDGKTPKELLMDQLTLLEKEIREVTENVNRNDLDKMIAHGRFLDERFRKPELF